MFFCDTPIYLRVLFYLDTKFWFLWINKYENLHYWKKKKIDSGKNVSQFSIKHKKKFKNGSQHNSITEICRVLFKYKNEREIGWDNFFETL